MIKQNLKLLMAIREAGMRQVDFARAVEEHFTQVSRVVNGHENLRKRISDGNILHLIDLFLKQEILEDMKLWSPISGTPQGAVLSPLLANVYLHQLDLTLHWNGFKMVRYADDWVVLNRINRLHKEASSPEC
jgi:hypothetical protein